jgi:ubiquinone/menaquinone biosynthesis C-methylase UbiE
MEKHQHCSKHMHHSGRKVEFLEGAERKKAFPPEELLQLLPIRKTDNILDLGAGTGYLAIPAAKMIEGLVYALDLDPKMLKLIASKTQAENITNIELVNGSVDTIPLPAFSVDIVLASLVLHEVNPLAKTLQQINRVLKDGGHLLCLEFEKTETPTPGAPMHIRIPSSTMEQELLNEGFSIIQKIFRQDSSYIIIAKK